MAEAAEVPSDDVEIRATRNFEFEELVLVVRKIVSAKNLSVIDKLIPKEFKTERLGVCYAVLIDYAVTEEKRNQNTETPSLSVKQLFIELLGRADNPKYIKDCVLMLRELFGNGLFAGPRDRKVASLDLVISLQVGANTARHRVNQASPSGSPLSSEALCPVSRQAREEGTDHILGENLSKKMIACPQARSHKDLLEKPATGCPAALAGTIQYFVGRANARLGLTASPPTQPDD